MIVKEGVILKTYDFLLYIIPQLEKFPKSQKFLLGDRIENLILDILEDFISANYSPKSEKREFLRKNNLRLEKLRYLIRLCHDLTFFSHSNYGVISAKINEIGKMNGSWIKTIEGKSHEDHQKSIF